MAEPAPPSDLLDELDRLLHEPARLLIVSQLYVVESSDFVFLLRHTGLTQGNLSSHLSKLEDANYVQIDKIFIGKRPKTMLRLTDEGRAAFARYAEQMRPLLALADD